MPTTEAGIDTNLWRDLYFVLGDPADGRRLRRAPLLQSPWFCGSGAAAGSWRWAGAVAQPIDGSRVGAPAGAGAGARRRREGRDHGAAEPRRRSAGCLLFGIPLALFLLVGVFLAIGLTSDPSTLPSALGRQAVRRNSTLPPLQGRDEHGLSRADLGGKPMLVNVFASWCVPCRIEHPI